MQTAFAGSDASRAQPEKSGALEILEKLPLSKLQTDYNTRMFFRDASTPSPEHEHAWRQGLEATVMPSVLNRLIAKIERTALHNVLPLTICRASCNRRGVGFRLVSTHCALLGQDVRAARDTKRDNHTVVHAYAVPQYVMQHCPLTGRCLLVTYIDSTQSL